MKKFFLMATIITAPLGAMQESPTIKIIPRCRKSFYCVVCSRNILNQSAQHISNHPTCAKCDRMFEKNEEMLLHVAACKLNVALKRRKCPECRMSFRNQEELQEHQRCY